METKAVRKREIRPFDAVLRDINQGYFVDDVTEKLTEVIAGVTRTGKPGSLTVTLKFMPRGSDNQQVEVIPSIKGVVPELERQISIFYANRDYGLQRNDPNQPGLPGIAGVDFDRDTGEILGGAR